MVGAREIVRFVLISGLPGSGKSTLAAALSPILKLPVIDKDAILERLFTAKGIGDSAWRRALSRESDTILRHEAEASGGAILVSHWHQPGMPADSGTPIDWIGRAVQVRCICDPRIAAQRFQARRRHPGHLDDVRPFDETLASISSLENLPPLEVEPCIEIDTSAEIDVERLAAEIQHAFDSRDQTANSEGDHRNQ